MQGFKELINSGKLLLVDFSATWCGPCKIMEPILKETKAALGDQATIIKIDIDRNREAAQQWEVQSVPTLILFQNGTVKWRQSGVIEAPALLKVLHQYIH